MGFQYQKFMCSLSIGVASFAGAMLVGMFFGMPLAYAQNSPHERAMQDSVQDRFKEEAIQEIQPPGMRRPQATTPQYTTIEALTRDGFEIKAMQNVMGKPQDFVIMLQRGAEIRSCLMRISRGESQAAARRTICF